MVVSASSAMEFVPGNVGPVSCVALQRLKTVLCSVFGHTQFRPGQLKAMLPALHGKDGMVKMAMHRSREITLHVHGAISVFQHSSGGHHQPTKCTDGRSGHFKILK